MNRNLFAYGTLQFAAIFKAVSGLDLPGVPATLAGFRREGVRGTVYPAIVPDPSAEVSGRLYRGLPRPALAALDRFEGDEYRRIVRTVITPGGDRVPACCYVIAARWRRRLDGTRWDPQAFEHLHVTAYLRRLHRE